MKVQLVSFPVYSRLTANRHYERVNAISKILNESTADFVMFSEHIFKDRSGLKDIEKQVHNKAITALLELNEGKGLNGNCMYLFQNGKWRYIDGQVFSESKEAVGSNIEELIKCLCGDYDFDDRRFTVAGKKFLIIHCGENNILKGSTGIAEFRMNDRPDLEERFEKLLNSVDVVLNPVHTKWGRFGNFLTRIRKFSENGRYCFSNCQMEGNQLEAARKNPAHNTTHVAMHNSELIAPIYTNEDEEYLVQTFEIK